MEVAISYLGIDVEGQQGRVPVVKRGVEFIDPTGTKFFNARVFRANFARQVAGRHIETFQVERATSTRSRWARHGRKALMSRQERR